jgi:GNAT superfamily N-acetyltransferase
MPRLNGWDCRLQGRRGNKTNIVGALCETRSIFAFRQGVVHISTIVIDSKSFEIAALLNKNKIGNIYLNIEYENNKPFFKLELLNVKPEARGLHIGSSLVNAAIDLAKSKKLDIKLVASPLGKKAPMTLAELTKFYEKFGFKVYDTDGLNNYMIKYA